MLEVEMKFAAMIWQDLERKLAAWGATDLGSRQEEDHYFNAPDRDFARTDEAVRIRRISSENFLTYKGPKKDAETKTRTEIEVPLAPGHEIANAMSQLLTHLGYRAVAAVEKRRRNFKVRKEGFNLEICLDEVKDVGRYVELEILAPDDQLDLARKTILAAAAELGLTTSERRSYLELLLAKKPKP
jgi:adenylate cyclase class 2